MARSNLDGQLIGRKGEETRQRLLDAAMTMLESTSLRDLRATDMARRAGISAATFYLYFENVEAVVLSLSDSLTDRAAELISLAERPWSVGDDTALSAFVRAYFDFWDAHRPLLRVRNLAAEEGDSRFVASRLKVSTPLHRAVAAKIDMSKERSEVPASLHSVTLAATLMAAMERNAAGYKMFPVKFGVSRERLIEATIFMIRSVLFGHNATA